jgi:hypothetical protein
MVEAGRLESEINFSVSAFLASATCACDVAENSGTSPSKDTIRIILLADLDMVLSP